MVKRIMGFVGLFVFCGGLFYKFYDEMSQVEDGFLIFLLFVAIIAILSLQIYKVVNKDR